MRHGGAAVYLKFSKIRGYSPLPCYKITLYDKKIHYLGICLTLQFFHKYIAIMALSRLFFLIILTKNMQK